MYVILKWNIIHAIFKIGFIATVRRINLKKWNLNLQNENFHIHTMWGLNEKKINKITNNIDNNKSNIAVSV